MFQKVSVRSLEYFEVCESLVFSSGRKKRWKRAAQAPNVTRSRGITITGPASRASFRWGRGRWRAAQPPARSRTALWAAAGMRSRTSSPAKTAPRKKQAVADARNYVSTRSASASFEPTGRKLRETYFILSSASYLQHLCWNYDFLDKGKEN